MPFTNVCFISYRHGGQEHSRKLIESFYQTLAGQLDLYIPGSRVYLDARRLRGGDFFDQELASQLCRSVCMILLFNPFYFDLSNPYCAREYRAMVGLEQQRLGLLPQGAAQRKSLIIPVVIRGEESLPEELKRHRQYYSFAKTLLGPADFRQRRCMEHIFKIAGDIFDRYQMFRSAGIDPCSQCDTFQFPTELEIRDWLTEVVAPPQSMPGR